ncbi:hypothetical protein TNCV_4792181 [Trichonephila clavipes]|nr:hypothetical protein TNCV_4792181 [Trichonephila clavipes]
MIVQFRNEKVSNRGSIPITIDCNVVAFIVFEEGFHQPIKRTKQSVFLDIADDPASDVSVQEISRNRRGRGRGYPNRLCYLRYCLMPVLTYHRRNFFDVSSGAGSLRTYRVFAVFYAFPAFSKTSMLLISLRSR